MPRTKKSKLAGKKTPPKQDNPTAPPIQEISVEVEQEIVLEEESPAQVVEETRPRPRWRVLSPIRYLTSGNEVVRAVPGDVLVDISAEQVASLPSYVIEPAE